MVFFVTVEEDLLRLSMIERRRMEDGRRKAEARSCTSGQGALCWSGLGNQCKQSGAQRDTTALDLRYSGSLSAVTCDASCLRLPFAQATPVAPSWKRAT